MATEAPATPSETMEALQQIDRQNMRQKIAEDLAMFFEKEVEPIPFGD